MSGRGAEAPASRRDYHRGRGWTYGKGGLLNTREEREREHAVGRVAEREREKYHGVMIKRFVGLQGERA